MDEREALRLDALRAYRVLDTEADAAIDRLAGLAGNLFSTPIALVSLIDEERQWFKAKVGLEAVRGVKTVTEIAQEYGVHPVVVGQWKKEILENAGALFDVKRGPKPVDESSPEDKLYSEIGKLKMQVDWLKKKLGE